MTKLEKIKTRIPEAEWLDNPASWDKKRFIAETSDYIYFLYGINHDFDRHVLVMLANEIDMYVRATIEINSNNLAIETNNGKTLAPHPAISIRNKSTDLILKLMKDLGLTLNSRINGNAKVVIEDAVDDLLKGPQL